MAERRWRSVALQDIATDDKYAVVGGPFGSKLGGRDYVPEGVPVLRGANLPLDREIALDDLVFVTDEKVETDLFGNVAYPGDIVVTQRGTLGQIGLLPDVADSPYERYVVSQSQMKLTVDPDKANNRFVYYALCSPGSVKRIQDLGMSSGVPHINLDIFRNFEIRLPELGVQEAIAAWLCGYNDLIANNRRRIEILEEMARLIYREWFVHFRFPGHEDVDLVNSDIGPIPKGWTRLNLFELADVGFGFSFKSKQFAGDGPFPVVRIRDIPNNATKTYTDEDAGDRYSILDGDILIGMDGDFHMCRWASGTAYLNQRVTRIRTLGVLSQYHLFLTLEQPIRNFNQSITGTTVAHLGKRHLQEIDIVVPSDDILDGATGILQPMFELEIALRKENRVLAAARDLLLPRLISGELDVSDLRLDLEPVA